MWNWVLLLDVWKFKILVISQGILKRFCWRPELWAGFLTFDEIPSPTLEGFRHEVKWLFLGQANQSAVPVTNRILLAITVTIGTVWIVSRSFNMLVPFRLLNIKCWFSMSKGLSARMTRIVSMWGYKCLTRAEVVPTKKFNPATSRIDLIVPKLTGLFCERQKGGAVCYLGSHQAYHLIYMSAKNPATFSMKFIHPKIHIQGPQRGGWYHMPVSVQEVFGQCH